MLKQQSKKNTIQKPGSVRERFHWALDVIDPQPRDCILEIGCGTGILADLLANRLGTGKIIAIDKSPAMVARACKRNQHHILNDRMLILQRGLCDLTHIVSHYSLIVAFNLNLFLNSEAEEFQVVRNALKPGGKFIWLQQPPANDPTLLQKMKQAVLANGFNIRDEVTFTAKPATCTGIIAV